MKLTLACVLAAVLSMPVLAAAGELALDLRDGRWIAAPLAAGDLARGLARGEARHVLAWLDGPADEALRTRLAAAGVTWLAPWSARAVLVRVAAGALPVVDGVRFSALPPGARRVVDHGGVWAAAARAGREATVLVRTHPGVAPEGIAAAAAPWGAQRISDGRGDLLLRLPAARLAELADLEGVAWVAPPRAPRGLANDVSRALIRVEDVQAAPYGLDGSGEVAGVCDGGPFNEEHPDMSGRYAFLDYPSGQHCGLGCAHATHVTCTVAGSGAFSADNGGAPRQWRGMAPAARVYGWNFDGNVDLEYRNGYLQQGVRVINNSWGSVVSGFGDCELYGAYDSEAEAKDDTTGGTSLPVPVTLLFAAGNDRARGICGFSPIPPYVNFGTVLPPATAKNVITVGAVDGSGKMTTFSGWGPTTDGRLKPDVVADGSRVVSCGDPRETDPRLNRWYVALSGTSMATPAATGATVLLRQDLVAHGLDTPPPAALKALLVHGARDISDITGSLVGPDYATGWGVIDVKASIDAARAGALVVGQIADGRTIRFGVDVPAGTAQFVATLAWDDPPGLPFAAAELVNDLDLVVVDPDGGTHLPLTLDPTHPAVPAEPRADHLNNLERAFVASPKPGRWTVEVQGTSVVSIAQGFALVTSPGGATAFQALAPGDQTVLPLDGQPPTFRWSTGQYTKFSVVVYEGTDRTRIVARSPWTDGTTWTPGGAVWKTILRRLRAGTLSWAVRARADRATDETARRTLAIPDPVMPSIYCPVAGAIFNPDGTPFWGGCDGASFLQWFAAPGSTASVTWSTHMDLSRGRTAGAGFALHDGFTPTATEWADIVRRAAAHGGDVWIGIAVRDPAGRVRYSVPQRLQVQQSAAR